MEEVVGWLGSADASDWLAVWGAIVATVLGAVRLWEAFFKDQPRLSAHFNWTGLAGAPDVIRLVNTTSGPLQVGSWGLEWVPRFGIGKKRVDVSPEREPDDDLHFKLEGHSHHDLLIYDDDKVDHSHQARRGKNLVLVLDIHGRKKPLRLVLMKGPIL